MSRRERPTGWFERRVVIHTVIATLAVVCLGLLIAEWFYAKHPYFGFDGWFGFYPAAGFGAYCLIVLSAKALRPLLRRDEDYYGEADPDEADLEESIGREHRDD
ncbi:hypothetical protein [Salinisphaera sp.]|uniref:hypothetical protein n=1 Tax=Salinisphaera sp. TaxID=1914330 RepID=UPI002D77BC48|nr:hypothetical protein [Salinisphaera sp.]HET7313749.1 hypothetical protein [Salinisphaera sp.]